MVTVSYVREGQRAAIIGPDRIILDLTSRIRFSSFCFCFSSKKAWIILCKTYPDPIWMAWSGFGQTQPGSKPVCKNHRAQFLTERNRSATSFPLSDSVPFFHRRPGQYCAKPARIRFGSGGLCHALAKRIRSGSKPMCKNHPARFWPVLSSRSGPDVNRIRHVYWDG